MARLVLLLLVAVALSGAARAQYGAVAGTITDRETGEGLAGANVTLRGEAGELGTAADADGRFAFGRLLPGEYVLRASFLGYEPFADTLEVGFGERVAVRVELGAEAAELEAVTVEEEAPPSSAAPAGLVRLRPADLAAVPTPDLAGGDLAGLLTAQPGVVTVGDRGGQLYVRGGEPTQNLVLVDGMRLFQPFHIVGFYSAVPAEIVQTADVYAGGFGAQYGGRISSVVDVQTRNGSKRRWSGALALAPFLASARADGPLVPGLVSAVVSVRESLVERLAAAAVGEPLPYRFGDAFGKLHAFFDARSFVTVSALVTHDEGSLAGADAEPSLDDDRVGWANRAVQGRFFFLPRDFPAALDLSAGYTGYDASLTSGGERDREALAESFGGEFALQYLLGRQRLRFGFGARTLRFQYRFDAGGPAAREGLTEGTAFVAGEFALGSGVRVEPGLRVQTFPAQRQTVSLEPRLRAAWTPAAAGRRHTLSGALGLYRQEIVGLTDARDIGDVFTAWAPVAAGQPLPRAAHAIAGWEARWRPWLVTSAEVYTKALAGQALLLDDRLTPTDGTARGLDLRAEWRRAPVYLLLTYGYGAVTYREGGQTYRPPHDRRHRAGLVVRWAPGPWDFSARAQLASGRPFTRIAGYVDVPPPPNPSGGLPTAPSTPTVLTEQPLYAAVTPGYARLDLSVERRFDLGPALLTVQAAAVNATDRDNLFYFDTRQARRVDQLPLLPSLGVRVDFE